MPYLQQFGKCMKHYLYKAGLIEEKRDDAGYCQAEREQCLGCNGSMFKIHLPCAEAVTEIPTGNETILLVEDNTQVRDLTQSVLGGQGYTEETIAPHGIVDLNKEDIFSPKRHREIKTP